MTVFGWIAHAAEPPPRWDLRRGRMTLCHGKDGCRAECRHVLICDASRLPQAQQIAIVEADRPAWRIVMVGIDDPAARADLLAAGCAEALPSTIGLEELHARVGRVAEMFGMLPRWRNCGPLVLDLLYRDARRGAGWLGLHPREFGVLWRLADEPGARVTRRDSLRDVWRLAHDPETNSVEAHVSRLRGKLALEGCEGLVRTAKEGGYCLADDAPFMLASDTARADALDAYLRNLDWTAIDAP